MPTNFNVPLTPPSLHLSSRPALLLALSFAGGIALAARAPALPGGLWAGAIVSCLVTAAAVHLYFRRRLVSPRRLALAILVIAAVVGLGGLRMHGWNAVPPDSIATVTDKAWEGADDSEAATITLWGAVATPPEDLSYGTRFVLSVDSAAGVGPTVGVRGRVQVLLGESRFGESTVFPSLFLGDRLEVTGVLDALPRQRNPADFDYGAYLARQGIGATMNIYNGEAIALLGSDAGPVDALVTASRKRVRKSISKHVRGEEVRAVLFALILADRRGIDPEIRATFASTGLMHLLAVSGLHVLLVGMLLYQLLKPVLGRFGFAWRQVEYLRASITLAVLMLYLLVTGGVVSVQRAFIMTAVWIIATPALRQADALNTLGLAGAIILFIRPAALFDVGFQLSFAAVAAIVTLVPLVSALLPQSWLQRKPSKWAANVVVVSIAATLGTAPVLLYHFGRVPLAGLVLNLAAIPATAVALFGGLLTVVAAGIPPVADGFAAIAEVGASWLLASSRIGAQHLDWAAVDGFVRDLWLVLGLGLALVALAFWNRPRPRWLLISAVLACLTASVWRGVVQGEAAPRLDVIFLDVGQGDAALISSPRGRHVLVDAGLRDPFTDQGERTILPHLYRFGVDRLDAVVLTHADLDHYGGLVSVMEEVEVGRIIHSGHRKENPFWMATLRAADSLNVAQQIVRAGDTLVVDPEITIRVLHPGRTPEPWEDGNDASVVLHLSYGETSFLLTGDVESFGESELVRRYGDLLASDVAKVAHHGSRTSSSTTFVAAATDSSTSFAVVSVAARNRYGLPDEEILATWQSAGAEVLLTGTEGAVWLRSDGVSVKRVSWR